MFNDLFVDFSKLVQIEFAGEFHKVRKLGVKFQGFQVGNVQTYAFFFGVAVVALIFFLIL